MKLLVVDDEPLAREELVYLLRQMPEVSHIAEADSVIAAMAKIMDEKPDVVFLDIHLTDESGFDLAERFIEMKEPPKVIFATAYDEYALKAFEVNAADYILKPFDEKRVSKALKKVIKNIDLTENTIQEQPSYQASIGLPVNDRIVVLNVKDILYASVNNGVLTVFLRDQHYDLTETLSWLEKKLDNKIFFKTHRSYLVNADAIKEVQPWFNHTYQITLIDGQKIPVSRSFVKDLKFRIGYN